MAVVMLALAGCRDPLVIPDAPDGAAEAAADGNDDLGGDTPTPDDAMDSSDATNDASTDTAPMDGSADGSGTEGGADVRTDTMVTDASPVDAMVVGTRIIAERRVTCGARTATPMVTAGATDRFLLRGRIVTPLTVIPRGEVLIAGTTIACVAASCAARPQAAGATIIETGGAIYPGLINGHDHLAYDWLPDWTPPSLSGSHGEWQRSAAYMAFTDVYSLNVGMHECAMSKYGEIRNLVTGTTTVQGAPNRTCLQTLIRNAEFAWDFPFDRHRTNVLGIDTVRGTGLTNLLADIAAGRVTTYLLHLSEGVNETARSEWDDLVTKMLNVPATVIIHGTAFRTAEHNAFGAIGGRMVWSPRSNVVLYGGTTDIPAAIATGTTVALAPDWTPTGSPSVLSELRYAREVSRRVFGGRLSSRDLVEMVTTRAARVLERQANIGELAEGRYADVMVVPDTGCDPYDTLIDAPAADVELVFVAGRPLFGDRAIMDALPATLTANCENVTFCAVDKRVCVSRGPTAPNGTNQTLVDVTNEIRTFYPTPYPLIPVCP